MDSLLQDLKLGLRQLTRRRGATLLVVLTLGLGVGANTSILALLNATMFKRPSVPDADQLTWVAGKNARSSRPGGLSYPDYRTVRDQAKSFSGVLAYTSLWAAVGGATPERAPALIVSGNYFDVLGIRPVLGRTFRADEDSVRGAHPVVVISHEYWKKRFALDRQVTDSQLTINGAQFAIIGVAPEGFEGVQMSDDGTLAFWATFAMVDRVMPGQAQYMERRLASWMSVIGRRSEGVALDAANAEVALIASRTVEPNTPADLVRSLLALPVLGSLDPANRGEIAPMAPLLLAAPMLLLIVAWANAANVLLARMMERRREMAVRRSLGAARGRIIRQLLTENALLGLAAAAAGVMLSTWISAAISRFGDIPKAIVDAIQPDLGVVLVTAGLAVTTGILFGIAPAMAATNPDLVPALKEEVATVSLGRRRHRLRDFFLVGQVAISLTLLITGGLFVQSVAKMLKVDPGFEPRGAISASFDLEMQKYAQPAQAAFSARLLDQVRGLPGVSSVALASTVPFVGRMWGNNAVAEGAPENERGVAVSQVSATEGIFDAQGLRLQKGRALAATDAAGTTPVVVISEGLASRLWPNGDPVGKRVRIGGNTSPFREVVGVIADVQYDDLASSPRPTVFIPLSQFPSAQLTIVARSEGDAAALSAPILAAVRALDPNLPVYTVRTLDALMVENGADKRQAAAAMLAVFGSIALFLAALGIYGATAQGVTLRHREIGIRMSLGARNAEVVRLFVREGFTRVLVGLGVGAAISIAVSRILGTFLFGLRATDAVTFVAGATFLCAIAVLSSWIPARRAAKIDPMVSLRTD